MPDSGITRAEDTATSTTSAVRKTPIKFESDTISIVETNVDDVTGEILGRTIERLMDEGAYDATALPYLGKKGRMGHTIRISCSAVSVEKFAQILVEETGTMGAKISKVTRLIVPRRVVEIPVVIENFKGMVKVKVTGTNGMLRIKPELADAKKISESQNVPLREVLESITFTARRLFMDESNHPVKKLT